RPCRMLPVTMARYYDPDCTRRGDRRFHPVDIRRQLGRLGDNRRVDIVDRVTAAAQELPDILQQFQAGNALIIWVAGREMLANVPLAQRADQRQLAGDVSSCCGDG
ncbi:MAG: hypothetical protein WCI45_03515, partial [Desulfuromonadales bacterium]